MRRNFLSLIAFFLFLSIGFSGCLDDETENYEYSTDASVRAFGLDTVYGKHYRFTIDQVNRLIYNRDSMPMGADTLLDSILIDTFSVTGYISCGANDTVLNTSNAQDLTPAINNPYGMEFKIHAGDGTTTRIYKLSINVHRLDPDSLVWSHISTLTTDGPLFQEPKAVLLGDGRIWIGTSATSSYVIEDPEGRNISAYPMDNLPEQTDLSSATYFNERVFLVNGRKLYGKTPEELYWSWEMIKEDQGTLLSIIHSDGKSLTMLTSKDGERRVLKLDEEGYSLREPVEEQFPTRRFYVSHFLTGNGVPEYIAVGATESGTATTPWLSLDGEHWADLGTTSDAYCPWMQNPAIMHYGDRFYLFGGDMSTIYESLTGIAWFPTTQKFLLPNAFAGKSRYSLVVDKQNYIWVIFGGDGSPNLEIWRGRLNRLGFERQ